MVREDIARIDAAYKAAGKAALERWKRNPQEFDGARLLSLPDDKGEFPRLLVLDQKDWIALGKIHYGQSTDSGHRAAIDSIRAAVESGKLGLPLTDVNFVETAFRGHETSRERLARFMVSLSRNYALHSDTRIYPMEVLDVIRRDLLGSKGLALIRRRVLAWGVRNVVGPAVLPTWPAWVSLQLDGLLDYPEV